MISVVLYSRQDCHLCDQAEAELASLQEEIPHNLVVIDIDQEPALMKAYGTEVPVVEVGPYRLKAPFTAEELRMTLQAAVDRERHIYSIDQADRDGTLEYGWTITKADRFSYWLSNHYMSLFNVFVIIYLGLPFLAPVLMAYGAPAPAGLIYRAYGAVCHQFAFRSFFLFGEQAVYPREAAGVQGLTPYGQATGLDERDVWAARNYIGDSQHGYKIALCERDVAIYGGILLFGLLFAVTDKRIKSLPWYFWILIGIMPIALDGFSQLLSQPPLSLLPYRESTPFLRTLTGALFGLTTAWFGYPMVEETMADTRRFMARKFAKVRQERENRLAGELPGQI